VDAPLAEALEDEVCDELGHTSGFARSGRPQTTKTRSGVR
jgi:hypothetical protein